jgi:hypothetical protein
MFRLVFQFMVHPTNSINLNLALSCILLPTNDRVECPSPSAALLELSALRVIDLNLNNLTDLPLAFCTMPNLGEPVLPLSAEIDPLAARVAFLGCRHANRIADVTCSMHASQHHPKQWHQARL